MVLCPLFLVSHSTVSFLYPRNRFFGTHAIVFFVPTQSFFFGTNAIVFLVPTQSFFWYPRNRFLVLGEYQNNTHIAGMTKTLKAQIQNEYDAQLSEYKASGMDDEKAKKKAFRTIAIKYHPDKGGSHEAFTILKDVSEYEGSLEQLLQEANQLLEDAKQFNEEVAHNNEQVAISIAQFQKKMEELEWRDAQWQTTNEALLEKADKQVWTSVEKDESLKDMWEWLEADEKAKKEDAEEKAEEKAQKDTEEKAQKEAEEKAQKDAEEEARKEEVEEEMEEEEAEKARREAEEAQIEEENEKARREAEEAQIEEENEKARKAEEEAQAAKKKAEEEAQREDEAKAAKKKAEEKEAKENAKEKERTRGEKRRSNDESFHKQKAAKRPMINIWQMDIKAIVTMVSNARPAPYAKSTFRDHCSAYSIIMRDNKWDLNDLREFIVESVNYMNDKGVMILPHYIIQNSADTHVGNRFKPSLQTIHNYFELPPRP